MLRAEQETIIRWDEEEKLVHVYSASPVVWRRLEKQGFAVQRETTRDGQPTGRFYVPIPLADFRWGKKRPRTAAQLEASRKAAARLQNRHEIMEAEQTSA